MKKNLNDKGITLAELIVSIALVAVAAVYFYQTLYTVNKLYKKSNDEVDEYVDENYYTRMLEAYYEYVTSGDNFFKISINSNNVNQPDILTVIGYKDDNGFPSTTKTKIDFEGCFDGWNSSYSSMGIAIPRFSLTSPLAFLKNINLLYINNSSLINKSIDFTCLNSNILLCENLGLEHYSQYERYKYSHIVGYSYDAEVLTNDSKFTVFGYYNNCFNNTIKSKIESDNNFWFAVEYNNSINGYKEKFGFDESPTNYYNPKYKLFLSVGTKDGKTYKYYRYFDHEKHLIDYETIISTSGQTNDRFKIWFNKSNVIVPR